MSHSTNPVLTHSGENERRFVSTLGIVGSCDFFPRNIIGPLNEYLNIRAINESKRAVSIFVKIDFLKEFAHEWLGQIHTPFVLVTGCSDYACSDNETTRLVASSPRLVKWLALNLTMNHPKMTNIPLAIDYHTQGNYAQWGSQTTLTAMQQETLFEQVLSHSRPVKERKLLAYCNFQYQTSPDRLDAIQKIDKTLLEWQPARLSRFESFAKMAQCAFVISPQGNGIDAHRTWEALAVGCIPIVKTCALDPLHRQFPILIVQDWSELTERMMRDFLESIEECPSKHEKLSLQYWRQYIRSFTE